MTEQEQRARWDVRLAEINPRYVPTRGDKVSAWLTERPGLTTIASMVVGASLMAAGMVAGGVTFGPRAHAESIMSPIDANGRMIDNSSPPAWLTQEERLERLERRSTAHCAETSYHLEARSIGLVCVHPAR